MLFFYHAMHHTNKTHRAKMTTPLLFLLGLLTSCDCMQRIQGYAIDGETGQPLSGVFYSRSSLLTAEEKQYERNDSPHRYQLQTDSTGWFMDGQLANGFNCKPHLILWLDKEGYQPVRLEWQPNQSSLDTLVVRLHRKDVQKQTN